MVCEGDSVQNIHRLTIDTEANEAEFNANSCLVQVIASGTIENNYLRDDLIL